jgi:serine/threonine protein kinase
VEFKVENYCGFLIRSKLMAADEMQAMRQRWQSEAKDATSASAFLKWLIAKEYVTEYQASLLSKGHVDDFYLGQYRIMERVGRGRMAGVYRAMHPAGQIVAIKVLPPSRAKNGQTLARFQREARLSVKLKHANVVRSFQVGEARGVHYLVMEYLEGETLEDVLERRKKLPPQEAVRLIHQALLGLQHIHEQGLVHRDLKPANLMLVPPPGANETTLKANVKILDIGLAREFFDENSTEPSERMELTGEGVLLGTPDYLAPEQARDPRTIDVRADIYSLGCTLYHLLTGQPPFPEKNILTQMIRHATEMPKPLQQFNAAIPEGLSQIVNWMMAKKPEERYPTPGRAAQALDAYLMVTSEAPKPAEESPEMKSYLTWLETSESGPDATRPPSPVPAPSPARPASNPNIPVAKPKPATNPSIQISDPKPATEKKRKKRTGVLMPDAPVAAPVAPAAKAMPAPVAVPQGDQFDVELVAIPPPSAARSTRSPVRDVVMMVVGAGIMFLFCMVGWLITFFLTSFRGE